MLIINRIFINPLVQSHFSIIYMLQKYDWTKRVINIRKCKYQNNKSFNQRMRGNISFDFFIYLTSRPTSSPGRFRTIYCFDSLKLVDLICQNFSLKLVDWPELKYSSKTKKYLDAAVKYKNYFPE